MVHYDFSVCFWAAVPSFRYCIKHHARYVDYYVPKQNRQHEFEP